MLHTVGEQTFLSHVGVGCWGISQEVVMKERDKGWIEVQKSRKSSETGEYLFASALYRILLYRVVGYFKEKKVS